MRVSRFIVPVVAVVTAAAMSGSPASAATPTSAPAVSAAVAEVGFQSSAFGTYVTALDATIRSGATSTSSITCTTTTGLTRTNTVATVNLPVVGSVGAVSTKVTTEGTGDTRSTTSESKTAGVNLLGGAIVADAVHVKSGATSVAGVNSGTNSTTFAGLNILGRAFSADVPANTRVNLDVGGTRVGVVILNMQTRTMRNGLFNSSTRGITITLLAGNPYGLPGSTSIYIGGTNAAVSTPRTARSGGHGFGVTATALNGTALVGRQPSVGVPCFGGVATGTLATITRDPLISTGTTKVTTSSSGNATTATSKVVTEIAAPRILGGLISADALVAEAQTTRTATGFTGTADRSRFVGLKVLGLPLVTDNVKPNTTLDVPGLGSVTFHKVVRSARGIQVIMLEIKLSESIAGLPTGTVVQVAGANTYIID